MKRFSFSLLTILLSAASLLCSCGSDWTRQGNVNFSAEFPGKAKDTATIEDNLYTLRLYYEPSKTSDPNAYYDVSSYTLPSELDLLGANLDDALKADAQVYAWSIDGTLDTAVATVRSGKHVGFQYTIRMPDNMGVVTMRKFVDGKKLYTLRVITPAAHLGNPEIKKFLDSFEIKEKAAEKK